MFLEEAVIPHLYVYPDESKTPLNACTYKKCPGILKLLLTAAFWNLDLYDFFMHGDLEALEKANGVRKSDVWFLLNGNKG